MYIAKYFSLSLKILKSRVWGAQDKINQVFFVFFLLFVCEFVNSFIFFISFSWKKKYPFFISIICFLFFFFFSQSIILTFIILSLFFFNLYHIFLPTPTKKTLSPASRNSYFGGEVCGGSEWVSIHFLFFFFFFSFPNAIFIFFLLFIFTLNFIISTIS